MKSVVSKLAPPWWTRLVSHLGKIEPGMRDTDLMTLGSTAGYELGLESAVPRLAHRAMTFDAAACDQPRHPIRRPGLRSYCGATYMGYGSCTYRRSSSAPADHPRKDWYKQVRDRLDA